MILLMGVPYLQIFENSKNHLLDGCTCFEKKLYEQQYIYVKLEYIQNQ